MFAVACVAGHIIYRFSTHLLAVLAYLSLFHEQVSAYVGRNE